MTLLRALFSIVFVATIVACSDTAEHSPTKTPDPGTDPLDKVGATVDFRDISAAVLGYDGFGEKSCTSCHSTYRNHSEVTKDIQKILTRVQLPESNPDVMPPVRKGYKKLSAERVALIERWVAAGLPEFVEDPDGQEPPAPPTLFFGFETIQPLIMEKHCTSCHTQYNDYAAVKNDLSKIAAVISTKTMPLEEKTNKILPLEDHEIKLFEEWAAFGGPEKPNTQAEDVELLPLEPTWISLQQNVFGPKCVMCHNAARRRGGLDISSPEAFEAKAERLFDEADPYNSRLIGAIIARWEQEYYDPMPAPWARVKLDPVTDEELLAIEAWITLGRPTGLPEEPVDPPEEGEGETPEEPGGESPQPPVADGEDDEDNPPTEPIDPVEGDGASEVVEIIEAAN